MPDSKPISELITAEQTSGSDLFEAAIPNAMTETGYISRKVTANALALLFNNTLQFSSQLQTTAKTLIGAINELAQGGGGGGASVAMGTTDPSASSGSNGDLYIKYDGTSYEVLAMFVKISGDWREIETGGGGGGGASSLDDLSDVDVDTTTLATGQMLVYNGTSGKFENASVSGNGHTYSTTEHVVGTWIDGSPLYEITLETNTQVNLDNQNWNTIPWNNEPSNIDFLVSIEITRVCPNTNYGLRFTNVDGHIKGASLISAPFPPVQNLTEYVVIRYTKSST